MTYRYLLALAAAALLLAGCTQWSERIALPSQPDPVWRTECSGCHTLYPPKLLTMSDWKQLMSQLDKHFGVDASINEQARVRITEYLLRDAAPDHYTRHHSDTLRITDTPWHRGKHGRSSIPVWRKSGEEKPSNCPACHKSPDEQLW